MTASPSTLPDACFDCNGTGACCRSFELGSVPEAEIRALERAGADQLVPALGGEPFYETREGEDGEPSHSLRLWDGACVFLGADAHCRVHSELGPELKPTMCRLFPLRVFDTPWGRRVGWIPDCLGRHRGGTTPLAARADEAVACSEPGLIREVPREGYTIAHGARLGDDAYLALERELLAEAARPRDDFDEVFPAMLDRLEAAARAAGIEPEPPVPEEARSFMLETVSDVFGVLAREALEARPDALVAWTLEGMLDMLSARPRPARLTPAASTILREELRNYLFTGSGAPFGGLTGGLGSFLFATWLVRGHVAATHGEPVDADALNEAWAWWHRGYGWRSLARFTTAHHPAFAGLLRTFSTM